MVSYLGLSNRDQASNQVTFNQGQSANNNSNQPEEDGFTTPQGPGQGQDFDHSFSGDNSSQFSQNDGSTNNFDNSDQFSTNNDQFNVDSNQQDQFSNGGGPGMGHQGGFDTTTGGT
jgi:hypothetical protein